MNTGHQSGVGMGLRSRGRTRITAKHVAAAVSCALASPVILLVWAWSRVGNDRPFISFGCLFGLIPGRVGSFLRIGYYMGTLAATSAEAQIGFGSFFSKRSARIGRMVRIGAYCVIGSATIGENVNIASRVSITSGRHQHGGGNGGPHQQGSQFDHITIGPGTWIGEGAIVMASVGANCIVGAGTVVVKPVPDGAIVHGPAAVVRMR